MNRILKLIGAYLCSLLNLGCSSAQEKPSQPPVLNFYELTINTLNGQEKIDFSAFKGKKILIVNVASACGYTNQYEDLQKLYKQYSDKLVIIGVPCNQFGFQESGTSEEIQEFCKVNFGVTFPLTEKVDVKGKQIHPIYQWLTRKELNKVGDYDVSWNFNKFLISEEGKLLEYFPSKVKPLSEEILSYLK